MFKRLLMCFKEDADFDETAFNEYVTKMNTDFDEFVETNGFFNTVDLVCKKTDFKPLSDTPIEPLNTGIEENEYTDRNDNNKHSTPETNKTENLIIR